MSQETKSTDENKDLDNLLNDALQDFKETPRTTSTSTTNNVTTSLPTTISSADTAPPPSDPLQTAFEAMCFDDEKFLNELESLPNFLSNFPFGLGQPTETDTNENQNIFNLFSQLGKHAELLQKIKDEDIEKALEKLADQSTDPNAATTGATATASAADEPHVEQLNLFMSSILSKDVMLPACQAVDESYEEWLTKNKESLTEQEVQRYRQQHQCVKDICQQYQTGSNNQQQMQRVLQKFQELQTYGDPPKELLLFPGFPGFSGGSAEQNLFGDAFADTDKVGENQADCSIM